MQSHLGSRDTFEKTRPRSSSVSFFFFFFFRKLFWHQVDTVDIRTELFVLFIFSPSLSDVQTPIRSGSECGRCNVAQLQGADLKCVTCVHSRKYKYKTLLSGQREQPARLITINQSLLRTDTRREKLRRFS